MTKVEEVNELLISHNCLRSLSIAMNQEYYSYDLTLVLSVSEDEAARTVLLSFFDISSFYCSEVGGGLTQFMHLKVRKLSSGLDRMNYQLDELEDNRLSFSFSSFEIDCPVQVSK